MQPSRSRACSDHAAGDLPRPPLADRRRHLGEVPAEFILEQSEGKLNYAWPAQVNRLIANGGFDLILSVGQVVPHEVIGMANYNKNILVGTGGREAITAAIILARCMGWSALWAALKIPCAMFSTTHPIIFCGIADCLRANRGRARGGRTRGGRGGRTLVVRGLFIGDDAECFRRAAN